ncbi:CRADD-like protein [Mya arenaria]|uniref:CRADD-like protein n=1 Tax=Mya arenaria TaxID=6604 RepID=A0ABY7F9B5_MYAAR|nr:uncharacterized protein LOC128205655 [Mya arenaria]XP_052763427.1 uncharacterized protein LOC128205655 [Mya arenaria]WAR17754.1 CRADD-like protein [Mya arenaria]
MDKREKSALRSAYRQLADELILDEDFFAALKQNKIFTDSMLGIIKGERTPRDKVYKMLELLEKRGPRAFDNFVAILKENYDWLAERLEEEFQKRTQSNKHHNPEPHIPHPMPLLRSIQYEPPSTAYFYPDHSPRPDMFRQTSVQQGASPRFHGLCPPNLQIPMSTPYIEDGQIRFFPYQLQPHHGFQTHQQTCLDNTDHSYKSAVNIEPGKEQETDKAEEERNLKGKYKDACISPIGVIELPRKTTTSNATETRVTDKEGSNADDEEKDQGFEESRSQTNEDGNMRQQLEEDKDSENNDQLDGPENINTRLKDRSPTKLDDTVQEMVKLDDDAAADDFPSSEVFYETVRRANSCLSYFHNNVQKAVEEMRTNEVQSEMQVYNEEDEIEDTMTRTVSSFSQNSEYQEIYDRMRELYFKLAAANAGSDDIEEDSEYFITWDILEDEVDRLIGKLSDSDDNKLMQECITLFPEKERRQPLNICIENLLELNVNMQEKLSTKSKEIDRMVYDMWNHQKDMKNIEKLKNLKDTLSKENKELKTTNQEITIALNEQRLVVVQKDQKIQELEGKIRQIEENKSMLLGPKRGSILSSNKRPTMTMTQASRRVPMEPRIAGIQASASTNQTPSQRSVNTALRRTYNATRR